MNNKNQKNYRPNVAAIILSPSYPEKVEVFLALRNDMDNAWQFPQGGIDEGEDSKEALFRELKEEIGCNDITIIASHPEWITYDFPDNVAKKMYPYDGQKQKYYLVKLNNISKINLDTEEPEFKDYKFVNINELHDNVTFFKRAVYKKVLKYFKYEGYL